MARLPQPGGDNGNWGDILNEYLSQTHKADGTLKDDVVTASAIANDTIQEAQLSSAVTAKLNAPASIADGSLAKTKLESSVQTSLSKADAAVPSASLDALVRDVAIPGYSALRHVPQGTDPTTTDVSVYVQQVIDEAAATSA